MAKDSQFVGPVTQSTFKTGGLDATLSAQKNGVQIGSRLQARTKSPNAQDEVTKVTYTKLGKPTNKG